MPDNEPWWQQALTGNIGGALASLGPKKPIGQEIFGKKKPSNSNSPWLAPNDPGKEQESLFPMAPPQGITLSPTVDYGKLVQALQADPGSFQDVITVDGQKLTASQVKDPATAAKWISGYLTSKNYATPSFVNTGGQTNALTDPIDPSVIAAYFKNYATPELNQAVTNAQSEAAGWQSQEQSDIKGMPAQFQGLFKAITGSQDQATNQTIQDERAIAANAPGLQYLMQLFASNTAAKQALQTAVQRYATGATITQPDMSVIQSLATQAASPGGYGVSSPTQPSLLNQLAIAQAGLPLGT